MKPVVVAINMGYGHLRAAHPLAGVLGADVLEADQAPLADAEERKLWGRARKLYELTSRLSQIPIIGVPLRRALDTLTDIPHLHPARDLSLPTRGTRVLDRLIGRGLGRGLAEHLKTTGAPLLTTFFAPAVAAERHGAERIHCVVTDADINRIWAPLASATTRIEYFVPSQRAARRMHAYGVPTERIHFTGFPLPHELLGGPDLPVLKRNLAARLSRLDPTGAFHSDYHQDELRQFLGDARADDRRPPLLTFAIGGAGAQAGLARDVLAGVRELVREERLRVALVAGVRRDIAANFREWIVESGLTEKSVQVLYEEQVPAYFARMNALLAETDILWTKPSEMTFFGALGIPLVFSWPVGVHERYNRRWAIESGAGLKQRDPRHASGWIGEWLQDGTLAASAWSGYMRLPKSGLYRILDAVASLVL